MNQRKTGAALAYVQIFLNIAIALFFTRVLVQSLGQSGYGLFSIVGSFIAYLVVMDMGMNDSVIRHLIRHRAGGNEAETRQFLGSMMSLYALVGLAILVVASLILFAIPRIFSGRVANSDIALLQSMFAVAAVATALTIALNPVGALVYAREQFVFIRLLEIAMNVASTMLMYIFLQHGMGALMVVTISYGSLVFAGTMKFAYLRLALGERIVYSRISWRRILPVILYSAPIFVAVVVEQIYWKLNNILIGVFIGVAEVAVYAIGIMFNKYFMSFATAISRVMVPEIIRRVDAGAEPGELTILLIRVARSQAIILMLVLTGLIIFGAEFITLWLGPEYARSYPVLLFALCPYALDLMGNVRNTVLQAKNMYWHRVTVFGIMALLNIPLSIALLKAYGIIGAAAGIGISILVGHFAILIVLQHKTGIRIGTYYAGLSRGLAPTVLTCLLLGLVLNSQLPIGWRALAVKAFAYTVLYALVLWRFGLDDLERADVRRAIGGMRSAYAR